jgi:predicted ATPase
VVARHEPQQHTALAFRLGYDPGIYARAVESWVLWLLGYPEQALRRSREALTLAREQSHPFTLALTLATVAVLQQLRREGEATLEHVKASLALSTEHGFPYLRTIATVREGWALARVGRMEQGLGQMRQGLDALRATGTELLRPYHLALLAEACGSCGEIEAGVCALEEAMVAADQHAERFYEAELHRLKGDLLLQKFAESGFAPAPTEIHTGHAVDARSSRWAPLQIEADACFQRALDIAQRQGARSLELRAAMSRYRLWYQLGNGAEARHLLTQVYDWFTEGFETVDLRQARGLLEGQA